VHDKATVKSWTFTLISVYGGMLTCISIGLRTIPDFAITFDNFTLINAVWAMYVLPNPAIYLIYLVAITLAAQLFFNLLLGV
jgi:hypothetical protein